MFTVAEEKTHLSLTYHNPSSANAFSLAAAKELRTVIKSYKRWFRPIVIKSGHPTVFCSGGDLTEYKKLKTRTAGLKINREIAQALDEFGRWPVIKLALINGDVIGGGMEWLGRFDYRWALPHVLMSFWQRRIGLSPGWRGGSWWVKRLGEPEFRSLLLEAKLMSASEAQRRRVIDRIVLPWQTEAEIQKWCEQMNFPTSSTLATWESKKESAIFNKLWMTRHHKEFLSRWK